jgi:Domain of unknown function (DUF2019)
MNDGALIVAFEQAAISYGEAHDKGNPKLANKAPDRVEAIYKQLQKRGATAMSMIIPLLDAENPWTRYGAAAYALDFSPQRAHSVLAELANAPKALGMMAYTTLRNWEMKNSQLQ